MKFPESNEAVQIDHFLDEKFYGSNNLSFKLI